MLSVRLLSLFFFGGMWTHLSAQSSPLSYRFSGPALSLRITPAFAVPPARPAPPLYSRVFLPRWSSADLPVFCKAEHQVGLRLPVAVKFRLGSVEYVDWLEGKPNSDNFQMYTR